MQPGRWSQRPIAVLALVAKAGTLPVALRALVPDVRAETSGLAARLATASPADQRRLLLDLIGKHVAGVLGHDDANRIDTRRAFKDLGFDSLTAIELRNRIGMAVGLALPTTLIFDYPSPDALAEHLRGELAGRAAEADTPVTTPMTRASSDEPIAIIAMIVWARHSDKTGERTWHVVIACLVAALGLLLAGGASSTVAVVAALTLVNCGISAAKPPLWAMPTMFLSGPAAAVGIATINSIGNLGGFVGPWAIGWIKDRTGSFTGGLVFVASLLVLSAVLTLVVARTARRTETARAVAH